MGFLRARQRLLEVNNWSRHIEGISAAFQLVNPEGQAVEEMAGKGLTIRIDIPGPGPSAGDGYDWAVIEDMEEGSTDTLDYVAFRVRPTENPSGSTGEAAHFFAAGSSGTFVLYRYRNDLTCTVYDRNLEPSTGEEAGFTDRVRNSVVGVTAAIGMSGIQWQKLTDAVMD